jgi:hypothetical protein
VAAEPSVERRVRGLALDLMARADRDDVARRVGWAVWPVGLALLVWVGRDQWFLRDDWAFLFSRSRLRETAGLDSMLLYPQDGHWMTWPIVVFHATRGVFGLGSYIPYLAVLWLTHVAVVALVRAWLVRLGVSAWTTTLLSAVLLLFGAGWENLLFAVQIVYNFSLIAFLAQTLLVDHDGPVDRRDWAGAGASLIGVSSSGFGPFFGFGVAMLLVLRRRWTAAAIAVIPQAVAWGWWWLTWGADPAGDAGNAGMGFVKDFVQFGVWSTLSSLVGTGILGYSALALCVAIVAWPGIGAARRAPLISFMATAFVMFAGIGLRREVFGTSAAGWPRYQYMAAMLFAPALAVGLDQARRFAPWARWVPRLLLAFAVARNTVWLRDGGDYWSAVAEFDRRVFSLVAGSDDRDAVPPDGAMTEMSPDVQVRDLDALVDAGAIVPRRPVDADDEELLFLALGYARTTGVVPPTAP